MDNVKPTIRTEAEVKARKAHELRDRGYKKSEIAAAMGLKSKSEVKELLRDQTDGAPGHDRKGS